MARRYGRRRGVRRRGHRRRYSAPSPKRIARVAKAAVSRMSETKEKIYPYDNIGGGAASFVSIGYGGSSQVAVLCGGIAQGTAGDQRVGRRIFLRGIHIHFAIQPGDNTNYLRLMLVRQKGQTDLSSNAAFLQELLGVGASPTQWANPIDTDKFVVKMDKTFTMRYSPTSGDPTATNTFPSIRVFRRFLKINCNMEYQNNTSGSLLRDWMLVGISDSSLVAHPGVVAGFVKLYYRDM